jgi:hypothetical protein
VEGGNGHVPPYASGALFGFGKKPAPRGPFDGAMVVALLEAQGWTPEQPTRSDEFQIWRLMGGETRVPVNPDWREFWEDDPIFRCLCRDLDLSADELVNLLQSQG